MLTRARGWWRQRRRRRMEKLAKEVLRLILERDEKDARIMESFATEYVEEERQRRLAGGDLSMIPGVTSPKAAANLSRIAMLGGRTIGVAPKPDKGSEE